MKETNIKVIEFGERLKLFTKRITLQGNDLSPKQIQSICSQIGHRYGVAATPNKIEKDCQEVLVHENSFIPSHSIAIDNWVVSPVTKTDRFILDFSLAEHQQLIADLYRRSLIIELNRNQNFWTLDSPRIFYQQTPFKIEDSEDKDIDAYRRFEISDVIIEDVGLGFSVDVSTAFFTNLSVDDYLSTGHQGRFKKLSGRQGEQQGTLLYDGPNKKVKCYYVRYHEELTLSTGHAIKLPDGTEYANPFNYFQDKYPDFDVQRDDRIAKVSFPGMNGPVDVPANRLYLRVMNSMLPRKMKNMDKIGPEEREKLLENEFWSKLGPNAFGKGFRTVQSGYYKPGSDKSGLVSLDNLQFGKGEILTAPSVPNEYTYREHFRKRRQLLNAKGCFYVPPQMERQLIVAYPTGLDEGIIDKYADDLTQKISELTDISVEPVIMPAYDSILEAAYQLRDEAETGIVLFIFNNHDPAAYYHISRELKEWKLKRATSGELLKKYRDFESNFKGRGIKNWDSYIELTAYDVLEQLGCIHYLMPADLHYDMQLVIDVSEKSSHFGLSLMFYNQNMPIPLFQCQTHAKHDPKNKEAINKVLLEKYLRHLFLSVKLKVERYKPKNLLILRDGKECGDEYQAIESVINELKGRGLLGEDFCFDFVEYHKTSQKGIRVWEREENKVGNALEGSYILLNRNQAVLLTTGSGTLNQGTAAPLLLVGKHSSDIDIKKVIEDVFRTSQLNHANPSVAQKLTFAAKRVDDQLIERRAQEVERIK